MQLVICINNEVIGFSPTVELIWKQVFIPNQFQIKCIQYGNFSQAQVEKKISRIKGGKISKLLNLRYLVYVIKVCAQ